MIPALLIVGDPFLAPHYCPQAPFPVHRVSWLPTGARSTRLLSLPYFYHFLFWGVTLSTAWGLPLAGCSGSLLWVLEAPSVLGI